MNLIQLAAAIITIESNGNDFAVGDGGRAIGAFQIHAGVVADVNRVYGTRYTHRGMTNRTDAHVVFQRYLSIYANGKPMEYCAKVWNGGPKGPNKQATEKYWNKVKSQ